MWSIIVVIFKLTLIVSVNSTANWWRLHQLRISIWTGRVLNSIAMAVALISSTIMVSIAYDVEYRAADDHLLPISDEYCRMPKLSSRLVIFLANETSSQDDEAIFKIVDLFGNCEERPFGTQQYGYGAYLEYKKPVDVNQSKFMTLLQEARKSAHEDSHPSLDDALDQIQSSADPKQSSINLGLLRETDEILFTGWLRLEKNEQEKTRTLVVSTAAYVPRPGGILVLVMVRVFEDEATIQDMLDTQSELVQRFLTSASIQMNPGPT